jgi:glycosyltransferase involved in cell wall biosynthesis
MISDRKKKIVYLIGTLRIGGAERQVVELAARLNRERFEPKLYCLSGGGPLEAYANQHAIDVTICRAHQGRICNARPRPFRYVHKLFSLMRYLQREQPAIMHTYTYTPSIYGRIAAKMTSNPLVVMGRRYLEHFQDGKSHSLALEHFLSRLADRVLVNSEAVKQWIFQREGIPSEKIQVLYNGVDTQTFQPVNGNMRGDPGRLAQKRILGIPENAPVVGIIANLIPYKGHRDFILAAAEVRRSYPETRFLCVGEDRGNQRQLERLSLELGLQDVMMFTGQVSKIPEILHVIDIQVSASHEEGFSNTILEGMASGKPIVATAVGGTPEAVVHQVTGLLVSPKNPAALAQAIIAILHNPELALQFGCNGRKRAVEYFSMEKMVQEVETLYLGLSALREAHS